MGETAPAASLADYQRFARRQWWVVLLVVYLAVAAGFGYLSVAPKSYRSTASVLVLPMDVDGTGTTTAAGKSTVNVDTEAQLVASAAVVAEAAKHLDPGVDPDSLRKQIGVTAPVNTSILEISFSATSPTAAQQGAQAFADAYLAVRLAQADGAITTSVTALQKQATTISAALRTASTPAAATRTTPRDRSFAQARESVLSSQLSNLQSRIVQLQAASTNPGSVIQKAHLPGSSVAPVKALVLGASLALGLLLGLAVGFLRHHLDRRVRTLDDVERRSGLEVLVSLPHTSRHSVAGPLGTGIPGRAYRRLHNVLVPSLDTGGQKGTVVLITRASPGATSDVTAELAVATSRAGTMVTVVSADLQASTLPQLLNLPQSPGLIQVLLRECPLRDALHEASEFADLSVLNAGDGGADYYDLLESTTMRAVVDELRTSSEVLFVESPSTASGADAQTLAIQADFAILVAERGVTTITHLQDAQRQFIRAGTTILGVVLLPKQTRRERRRTARGTSPQPSLADDVATTLEPTGPQGADSAPLAVPAPNVAPHGQRRRLLGRAQRSTPTERVHS